MFRKPQTRDRLPRNDSIEAKLQALGYLLDQRGYAEQGLCVLAADGGFVVNGFRMPERGAAYSLVQQTESIDAAELAATIARLHGAS